MNWKKYKEVMSFDASIDLIEERQKQTESNGKFSLILGLLFSMFLTVLALGNLITWRVTGLEILLGVLSVFFFLEYYWYRNRWVMLQWIIYMKTTYESYNPDPENK